MEAKYKHLDAGRWLLDSGPWLLAPRSPKLVLVLVLDTGIWLLASNLWSADFAAGLERKEKNQSTDYADYTDYFGLKAQSNYGARAPAGKLVSW